MSADAPLSGLSVVVTRDRAQSDKLGAALEAAGARVIAFPVISIETSMDAPPFHAHTHFDWTLFTSVNAVRFFAERVRAEKWDPRKLDLGRVGAVGPATREAAESLGLDVALVPDEHDADALLEAVETADSALAGHRVLLPRGNIARDTLLFGLRSVGAIVTPWTVYENTPFEPDPGDVAALLAAGPDVVTFTSASTASNFAAILGPRDLDAVSQLAVFVSIGPQTTAAANASGMTVAAEAQPHTIPGLVNAVIRWRSSTA